MATIRLHNTERISIVFGFHHGELVSRRQAVLGRQHLATTPWLTERHGYDPTWFCDAFVWSLKTNEVREVAAMANSNLNKTQSLNGALRAVYMEEEGGISWPLVEGSEINPISCFLTHTDSKNSLYLCISKLHGPGPIIR